MNLKRLISVFLCSVMMLCLLPGCAKASDSVSDEKMATIRNTAEERKQAILNSPTTIVKADKYVKGESYSGTAYYVSNNGNDANNGRSPEAPFATVSPFDEIELHYGDAVFFERGSCWRAMTLPWSILGTEGVTISAYGEGEKPKFYGSIENGSGAEKWTLAYEDTDGKKIWRYYKDMTEVATIVLNGEEVVKRDIAYWNGDNYLEMDENYELIGSNYSVEADLKNMWCFPYLEYPRENYEAFGDRIFVKWNEEFGEYVMGPLYFRCDTGNPGELYEDIEFIQPYPLVDGFADSMVFDNLCIMYSSMTFTSGGDHEGPNNNGVIQNCEVGWMGGNVAGYVTGAESGDTRIELNYGLFGRNGGCISINGSGFVVQNNYVHHSFQEGIAAETFSGDPAMTDNYIAGNLVESCQQAILLCNWDMEVISDRMFRNITFEDNIVIDTGKQNFFNSAWETIMCEAFVLQGGPCAHDGTVVVRNNIFALSVAPLIQIEQYTDTYSKIFDGNTYIQYKNGDGIIVWNLDDYTTYTLDNHVTQLLGDDNAIVAIVP